MICDLGASSEHAPGRTTRVPGRTTRVPGRTTRVPGCTTRVPGCATRVLKCGGGATTVRRMLGESVIEEFNVAEPQDAERELLACCAARRWADELIARRPYHDLATIQQVSDTVINRLSWSDVERALA